MSLWVQDFNLLTSAVCTFAMCGAHLRGAYLPLGLSPRGDFCTVHSSDGQFNDCRLTDLQFGGELLQSLDSVMVEANVDLFGGWHRCSVTIPLCS